MEHTPEDYSFCVINARMNLKRFEQDFKSSLELYRLVSSIQFPMNYENIQRKMNFSLVAARDAVLNVYHFGKSLKQIRENIGKSREYIEIKQTLKAEERTNKIKEATRLFNRNFKEIDIVRHSIAHAGELMENPYRMKKNMIIESNNGSQENINFSCHYGLCETKFTSTFSGRKIEIDIGEETLNKLSKIRIIVDSAF